MGFEVLILNSGEWVLGEELAASPWHVLIYRQRGAPGNELHVWLPRQGAPRPSDYAFKRYWDDRSTRWCVEVPLGAARPRQPRTAATRFRFSAPDGRVIWSDNPDCSGLGDLSETDLLRLLEAGYTGSFSGH